MKLKELLKLAQTDPTEALKVAYDMGSSIGTADQEYTRDQFMAFMDGAKAESGSSDDLLERYREIIRKMNEHRIEINKPVTQPKTDQGIYPNNPINPTVSPFWYMDGPTCQAESTDSTLNPEDSLQPKET